jgi:hypothetical protein
MEATGGVLTPEQANNLFNTALEYADKPSAREHEALIDSRNRDDAKHTREYRLEITTLIVGGILIFGCIALAVFMSDTAHRQDRLDTILHFALGGAGGGTGGYFLGARRQKRRNSD